jgi:site-specific recombinase XerC
LLVAMQTGLRVSELTHLRCEEVTLGTGAHLRCEGKGRKQRCTPLRRDTVAVVAACRATPYSQVRAAGVSVGMPWRADSPHMRRPPSAGVPRSHASA